MAKYKAKVNTKEVENNKKNINGNTKKSKEVKSKSNSKSTKKIEKKISKTIKQGSSLTDTQVQVRNFVIILLIVVVLVVGLYLISTLVVDKRTENNLTNTTEVDINYDIASVGMILNRPYNEYYVLVYDSSDNNAMYYSSLLSNYSNKDNALKIYFTDLGSTINKSYKATGETGNSNVTSNVDDFSFSDITLLKVSNGSVVNYYEGLESVESILK